MSDRRIEKTKNSIQQALAELLLESPIEKVSIKRLCEQANVHRSTFYAHYDDIYAVHDSLFAIVLAQFEVIEQKTISYQQRIMLMLHFVEANQSIMRLIFKVNHPLYHRFETLLMTDFITFYEQALERSLDEITKFVVSYHVQGVVAIVSQWLDSRCRLDKVSLSKLIEELEITIDDKVLGSRR